MYWPDIPHTIPHDNKQLHMKPRCKECDIRVDISHLVAAGVPSEKNKRQGKPEMSKNVQHPTIKYIVKGRAYKFCTLLAANHDIFGC